MTQAVWRLSGWAVRMTLVAAAFLTAQPPNRLTAQVGHDPAQSPYRDILRRSGPVLFVGHLSGDRGNVDAGVSNAVTFGTRYEIPAGRSLQFQFSAAYLQGDRFVINPTVDSTSPNRRTGPVQADVLLTDIGLQLRLTGAKTWHGIAPYVGAGFGLAFGINSPADTASGYKFGTKLTVAAATGIRWYPARRLLINGDLRAQLWRLRYPVSFHTAAPDGSRVVPLSQALTDWTLHPWISLGVGWTF